VVDATARKVPFGIAQIGKSFRNEINPRNFVFRVREMEQMELEFFVKPGEDDKWHEYWKDARLKWWYEQGLTPDNIKAVPIDKEELAHYSKATYDLYYKYPHGWDELEGVANRTDYDLGNHTKNQKDYNIQAQVHENSDSVESLAIFDDQDRKWFVPFVVEPSCGVERGLLAVMSEAYTEEALPSGDVRTVMKFKPHLAPVKVAVIPLKRNEQRIVGLAKDLKNRLLKTGVGRIMFEDSGNIGKAYRRHDEIGTPYCLTVDFESLDDNSVTIRYRDTMKQERIALAKIEDYIKGLFGA
jgi:glycyl-tRNA synthetase